MGYIKSPQPVNKQRQSLLTTQRTPQERDWGANFLARSCGVLLYNKSDWRCKFTKFIRYEDN